MLPSVLEIHSLTKSYDGIPAVDGVSLHVGEGEIVGLVGENGAGKSTIMNVLCGVAGEWSGKVILNDQSISPKNFHEAVQFGIGRVYQESSLVPTLSIYENMFLSHETRFTRMGIFVDSSSMIMAANAMLEQFQLDLDVRREAGAFDFSTRQVIEIAKACLLAETLSADHPLILLDEPTSALTREEIELLFARLRQLKARGSFLFVSRRLSEVLDVADRIYVLKDGRIIAEVNASESDESTLHELMVGRKRDRDYIAKISRLTRNRVLFVSVSIWGWKESSRRSRLIFDQVRFWALGECSGPARRAWSRCRRSRTMGFG